MVIEQGTVQELPFTIEPLSPKRVHQALDYQTPAEVYFHQA